MTWVNEVKSNIEIEEPKLDLSLFRKKGNAKTYAGYLIAKMKQARDEENKEIVHLLNHLYQKYMEFHKKESKALVEIEIVEGWKGIDDISIFKGFENNFIIESHIKDKETHEVTTTTHQIPFEKVNTILYVIKRMEVGEKVKCYDFAPHLGYSEWKDLWRERKDYFDLYYYPIKVLEALGIIKYGGRGDITRLK